MGLRILHHFRALTLGMLTTLVVALSSVFKTRAALQLENLALRHQLGVLHRSVKKPKLTPLDRLLWAWLCGVWADWRSALMVVKPETLIAWHRKGFRLFWTWKVRRGPCGCPSVPKDVRDLIRLMSRANPTWGVGKPCIPPRVRGADELATLLKNRHARISILSQQRGRAISKPLAKVPTTSSGATNKVDPARMNLRNEEHHEARREDTPQPAARDFAARFFPAVRSGCAYIVVTRACVAFQSSYHARLLWRARRWRRRPRAWLRNRALAGVLDPV